MNDSLLNKEELERLAAMAKEQAQAVFRKLPLLGPVTWLMMQQGASRNIFVSELEWRVMPALVLDQAKLYMRDDSPVAFVTWALLSQDGVQRYRQSPARLNPAEWRSGDQVWIIDLIAPFGSAHEVLKDLRENVFPTRTVHQLIPGEMQAVKTMAWPAVASTDLQH